MAIFGLGSKVQPAAKDDKKEVKQTKTAENSASDEAKAVLAKMQAKKDAGDCPFC